MPNPLSGGAVVVGRHRRGPIVGGTQQGIQQKRRSEPEPQSLQKSKPRPEISRPGGWVLKVPPRNNQEIEKIIGDSWRFVERFGSVPEKSWKGATIDFSADPVRCVSVVQNPLLCHDKSSEGIVTCFATQDFPDGNRVVSLISNRVSNFFGAAVFVSLWQDYCAHRADRTPVLSILEGWFYGKNQISHLAFPIDRIQRPGSAEVFMVFSRVAESRWEIKPRPFARLWFDPMNPLMVIPCILP